MTFALWLIYILYVTRWLSMKPFQEKETPMHLTDADGVCGKQKQEMSLVHSLFQAAQRGWAHTQHFGCGLGITFERLVHDSSAGKGLSL